MKILRRDRHACPYNTGFREKKMSAEFLKAIGAKNSFKEIKNSKLAKEIVALARKEFEGPGEIPSTTYTLYRQFLREGTRPGYETPYFLKRKQLALAVLAAYFTREQFFIDKTSDYLINICEETTWVCPAHELHSGRIDLMSADTGLELSEAVSLLSDMLPFEIIMRVKSEIEKRIFEPYLKHYRDIFWYKFRNNWSGVCNSCVGATFLHLETDKKRLKRALELVLDGLEAFIEKAFESDGGSTEGVGYWSYGLSNYIMFSELLRSHTKGRVDLLSGAKMKNIAAYPLKMLLSNGVYANFSDCGEKVTFAPGMIIKLAERTNSPDMYNLLSSYVPSQSLYQQLRNLCWQKEKKVKILPFSAVNIDMFLKSTQIVKLTAKTASRKNIVLMAKGGHNEENHNHNDVGSFILHVDGENLICDPGAGLYSKAYFTDVTRNKNIFCNSYGHNLPVIGGQLQKRGIDFKGKVTAYKPDWKLVEIEFAKAYGLPAVKSIKRNLFIRAEEDRVIMEDSFNLSKAMKVEEAFLSWFPVVCNGSLARIKGKKSTLILKIEEPRGAVFSVKKLEKECKENAKTGVLNRLAFNVPKKSKNTFVRVSIKVI